MMKRICFITGSRAEYGLLHALMKNVEAEPDFELQIIATGAHFSPGLGRTYLEIEADGFAIDEKVDIPLPKTSAAMLTYVANAVDQTGHALQRLQPDLVIVLGDRYEIFAAASAACLLKIPLAHIHGGELTEGAIDDVFRHCVTKMSHLHFVSADEYRRRVIQLGENPDSVYNVGALAIDNIKNMPLLAKQDLENDLNLAFDRQVLLVTFHPETLSDISVSEQCQIMLDALDTFKDVIMIFTKANADQGGDVVNHMLETYAAKRPADRKVFASLGCLRYLSFLQYVDGVVGNSSSGIIEVPSFHIGTVNVGDRQKGRIRADSVVDCPFDKDRICQSIQKILSPAFKDGIKTMANPYGDGSTGGRILDVLKTSHFKNLTLKSFFDCKFDNKEEVWK
ncbi:MAG: UDP-N-acetylglucosamine 2-epimerase [Candidatus Omnitrophica bacterium]|nr:UDP-N-acetylglucosamine 2-epimerase [Candidatus Omnitrophota bacterium]